MELPKRKPNRLKGFSYSTNGMYFITICTNDKEKLLGDIVGGGAFDAPKTQLSLFGKIVEKYIRSTNRIERVTVEKYVVMPNHIHMLIFVRGGCGVSCEAAPANDIIPHLVSTLKRFVNKEIGEDIFQRSYHDHVVRGTKDYQKIWTYIDNNPAKWKEDCFYTE